MARRVVKNIALLALLAASAAGMQAFASEPTDAPALRSKVFKIPDMSKSRIELPVKGLIGDLRMPVASDSRAKGIEISKAPASRNSARSLDSQKPALKPAPSQKVEPGKVRWHKAIQTAMDASAQSGKPVLLFQMMGRLDDRFC